MAGPVVALVLAAALADYQPQSADWNGLRSVVDAAAAAGCPVEERASLDWSRLTGNDVLWFVYPRARVDPRRLALYLEAGGRALVADDFGGAGDAFARLELARAGGAVGAARYYQGNPKLPEADSSSESTLARAAPAIVANHPAHFATAAPAAYRFSERAALVVEGTLGRGRFVALADPSVLINDMQQIEENRRFAAALVAATCRPHLDRILLVSGDFTDGGEPPARLAGAPEGRRPPPASARDFFNDALAAVNDLAPRPGAEPPDGALLAAFALAATALMLLALLRGLPGRTPGYDGSWTRAPALARSGPAREWTRALPAAILREEALARVSEAIGEPASLLASDEVAARLARRCGQEAASLSRALWLEIARLRRRGADTEAGAASQERRRLARAHRLAVELFARIEPARAKVSG